ncbi:Immune inhibitor A peptidase M6 [Friedmanniella luteola]|uniref:Zinc carboxypeptidase n=1 Tax=Friedmanniella luteola TaxID=546871 RepID=A0A1H1RSP6_9ACTN|nr:M14 family metallopeptidase [Friedmanniella luteola]SDS38755.1 Immune inhibitor A peptidase M6 [Friedmanniella luteola]
MRRKVVLLVIGALVATALGSAPPASAAPTTEPGPTVYVGELTADQLGEVGDLGLDREELVSRGRAGDKFRVEVVLSRRQAAKLEAIGVELTEKEVAGTRVSQRLSEQNASGHAVFRSYSEAGGLRDELVALSRQYPRLTKLVRIGRTVQGQDILAVKVTKNARRVRDGSRPAVLYSSAQHAREWITPEMNRRLLHHVLEQYASDAAVHRVVDRTELWFVPVANPDGYDHTFTEGNRLWRKNLRDNDGDGAITAFDGVDLNRNFPYRWGYDDEGSSPSPTGETYRGPSPASEPETRALDGLMRRVGFEFQVNYHSAAELLLYGVGWQVATPTPDDLLYEALAGDDARPAVPGYDPDIAAELYTTNGETTEHAHNRYGTLAFTPEMSTCETASAVDPDDAFSPEDCESVFNFPDSEALVQAEFEKNLPFALAVARSAPDPDDPVSVVGRTAPDFAVDSFTTSYGDPQPVAVTARRDLRRLRMQYSINGGRTHTARVREWRGGERYGDEADVYYAEYRGVVRGADPGDDVKVWFTGHRRGQGTKASASFTYRLAEDTRNPVLVLPNEDYEGVNPQETPTGTGPEYADAHVAALDAAGYEASVWDVSAQGVPHDLGVLSHFTTVLWYLGDNRLTQDPEDALTQIGSSQVPDAAVAERQQYLTLAVRDYLNEGGKLLHAGETAGYSGTLGSTIGGIYYGLDGAPEADCVVTQDIFSDCLLLADDFYQYYLGAYSRATAPNPLAFTGAGDLAGAVGTFGGPAAVANPLDEPGTFVPTSAVLPPGRFPQFASEAAGGYEGAAGGAFDPVEGETYVGVVHVDDAYQRLARTFDLTDVTASQTPSLAAQLSFDTEEGYDHVIVEAHPVGSDDWTTLPETGGLTSTALPAECEAGFLLEEHPFLEHYLTPGDPCTATGTTGAWHTMTGSSGGWQEATFDLSAYAGQQVEVSISYVSDPSTGGIGLVVDDTALLVGGVTTQAEGFEAGLGAWSVLGPPSGSPTVGVDFVRSEALLSGAVTTEDSVLLGFGLEQVESATERAAIVRTAMRHLVGGDVSPAATTTR